MSFSSDIKQELNKNSSLVNKEKVENELIGYLISANTTITGENIKYTTENDYNINGFSKLLTNLNLDHKIDIIRKKFCNNSKKEKNKLCKIRRKPNIYKRIK